MRLHYKRKMSPNVWLKRGLEPIYIIGQFGLGVGRADNVSLFITFSYFNIGIWMPCRLAAAMACS